MDSSKPVTGFAKTKRFVNILYSTAVLCMHIYWYNEDDKFFYGGGGEGCSFRMSQLCEITDEGSV